MNQVVASPCALRRIPAPSRGHLSSGVLRFNAPKSLYSRGPSRRGAAERSTPLDSQPQASTQSAASVSDSRGPQPSEPAPSYDMNIWHYKPWWCQPPTILLAGVGFIVASNLLTEVSWKTTILAAGPVALWWYIFLWVLPAQFKEFASEYIATHPECTHDREKDQNQN